MPPTNGKMCVYIYISMYRHIHIYRCICVNIYIYVYYILSTISNIYIYTHIRIKVKIMILQEIVTTRMPFHLHDFQANRDSRNFTFICNDFTADFRLCVPSSFPCCCSLVLPCSSGTTGWVSGICCWGFIFTERKQPFALDMMALVICKIYCRCLLC